MIISNVSYTLNTKKRTLAKATPQYTSFKAVPQKSSIFKFITVPFNEHIKPVLNKYITLPFNKYIKEPFIRFYDRQTTKLAKGFAKLFEYKKLKDIIESTQDNQDLTRILTTVTSTVLSGFYMQQTLKNKDLDPKKKKTLAINQALSFILPTIGAWTLDSKTDKFVEKHFSDKYSAVNYLRPEAKKLFHGIQRAKSIVIFGLFYRYLAPVIVTPLANYIGNKLNEKNGTK